ncbi:MAG: polyketide synthase, partial [bacterium]|nr:polyketide synthase [bacterium]
MPDASEETNLTGYEVAVIGMACRFPGAAAIGQYWDNLKNSRETVYFFSDEELSETGVISESLENPNYIKAKALLGDTGCFDAFFFNYTIPEAGHMDPQLHVLMECAWEGLEDAGYNPDAYNGLIGLYCGGTTNLAWMDRVMEVLNSGSDPLGIASLNSNSSFSTQLAYRLNLKGPAVTVQTACSTSLVAIHTACQALISSECDMALAGGVSIQLPVKNGYLHKEGMVLAPDGHCRAFDAKAAGCVEGNGAGIVLLKLLENALE